MSKFRRQIRNLGRAASGGLGFHPARSNERPLQVIVAADVTSGSEATAAVEAGAHVLVASAGAVADTVAAAGTRPVGVRLHAATADSIASAVSAGADFFVFDDASTPAVALLRPRDDSSEPAGRLLILGDDHSEERLRAAAGLGADAVLLDGMTANMTVRDQLALRRISELTGAPVLIAAPTAPSTDVLRTWRDAGAPMVLVPGADAATVRAAVAAAADVPPTRRPRDDRPALVPSLAAHTHEEEDEDF